MRFCKTSIYFDQTNQQLNCSFEPESTLALNADGPTDTQNADVLLKLDDNGELTVLRNSDKPITLERAGRARELPTLQIRLCEGDTIRIDSAALRITRSTFTAARPKISATSRILAASAALCSLALTACDDSCDLGETKCQDNAVYECTDSSWTLKEKCEGDLDPVCKMFENNATCIPTRTSGAVAEPECLTGETKCQDNAVYECDGETWQLKEKCESNLDSVCEMIANKATCMSMRISGDMPMQECSPGESMCIGNAIYACKDYTWQLAEDCEDLMCTETANGATCVAVTQESGMMLPECPEGQTRCEDNSVYECKAGEWQLKESCDELSECTTIDNEASCVMVRTSGVMPTEPPEPDPIPDK